jgi:hypothetical protein
VLLIHTDNVYWISARTDAVCAVFYLLTRIALTGCIETRQVRYGVRTAACFMLALWSKEMAWSLPGAVLLVMVCRGCAARRRLAGLYGVVLALYGGYFALRYCAVGEFIGHRPNNADLSASNIASSFLVANSIFSVAGWGGLPLLKHFTHGFYAITGAPLLGNATQRAFWPPFALVSGLWLTSFVPVVGFVNRWYLYIPSAFASIAVAYVWPASRGRRRVCRLARSDRSTRRLPILRCQRRPEWRC